MVTIQKTLQNLLNPNNPKKTTSQQTKASTKQKRLNNHLPIPLQTLFHNPHQNKYIFII